MSGLRYRKEEEEDVRLEEDRILQVYVAAQAHREETMVPAILRKT
jgi:hypothetical protein